MKFKLFKIDVELQFFAILILTFALVLDTSSKVALCVFSAFIHEFGHLFMMLCMRKKPKLIKLRAFDIAIIDESEKSLLCDLCITLAGPLFNLLLACVSYFFSTPLFVCNVALCVFNLLPVDTFDGGHALYILLSQKLSEKHVNMILKIFTLILLIPIFILGIIVLFYSKYNYSLLAISLYLLVILFVK